MIEPDTRILIVDDQDLVGDIVRAMLTSFGIKHVEQAKDGWDALLRLRSKPFDLVLVDFNLGSMNGLQLLRSIRRDDHLRQQLVIMITADRSEKVLQEAKAALVNAILHKPFKRIDLEAAIEDVFRVWRPSQDAVCSRLSSSASVRLGGSERPRYLDRP